MGEVTLIPLTEEERKAFFIEEVANYADQQVRDAGWSRHEALERAREELTPVLAREYAEGVEEAHQLWSAIDGTGRSVGWLWVKPLGDASLRVAFLEQITVAQTARRQGYGRAMLAALEELLARGGIEELRLNVFRANAAARALYAAANYEHAGEDERRCFLRKHLAGPRSAD
jgi:ribosomal protein S18 acetylase RimI-like enzyme